MWNKDEIAGKGKQIKGTVKDKLGELTNNPELEAEGEAENTTGKLQQGLGTAKRKTGDAVEEIGKSISK